MNALRWLSYFSVGCSGKSCQKTSAIVAVLAISVMQIAAHGQSITSFSDLFGKHAVFVANDSSVHQLYCGSGCNITSNWSNQNLTVMAGGAAAGRFSTVTSYSDALGEHVFFVDAKQQLSQFLFAGGRWTSEPLAVLSWGMGISGYSNAGTERLFYEAGDQHVHVLDSTDSQHWSDGDLTRLTGGTQALWGTGFTSFHDGFGEHAIYVSASEHIYQLYGSWVEYCIPQCHTILRWSNQDLTNQTGGPRVAGPILTSFSDGMGEHVFYLGSDWHVHQLYHGSSWVDQDLTVTSGGVLPFSGTEGQSGLTSYATLASTGEQAYDVGTDLHVYQLFWNGSTWPNGSAWDDEDLTVASGGPTVSTCGGLQLTSFTDESSGQVFEDVFYIGNDGDLHRLSSVALPFGWMDQNLTQAQPLSNLPLNFCIQ